MMKNWVKERFKLPLTVNYLETWTNLVISMQKEELKIDSSRKNFWEINALSLKLNPIMQQMGQTVVLIIK